MKFLLQLLFAPLRGHLIGYSRRLSATVVPVAFCLCITHCQQVLKPIAFRLPASLSLSLCHFTLLFLSLTSSFFFFFSARHCPQSFSARDLQSLPIYFVAVVSPSALQFRLHTFFLLLFCPFSAQRGRRLSACSFIVFSRFSTKKKKNLFVYQSASILLGLLLSLGRTLFMFYLHISHIGHIKNKK